MAAILKHRVRTTQPQPWEAVSIDWSNPITRDLLVCASHADASYGLFPNGQMTSYSGGAQSNTPLGTGGRSSSTSSALYTTPNGITSTNYSLFAVGSATSASVIQSALDMDNGTTRYFQFRLANGKADFIPFNTSAGVTGEATSPVALSVAELSRGFTMGATASSTRTAVFQNGIVTAATPSNLIAPGTVFPISIGARVAGNQGWATGALMLVMVWNRTLTDAEMVSLNDNPWQVFKPSMRRMWFAFMAATTTITGTIGMVGASGILSLSGSEIFIGNIATNANNSTLGISGSIINSGSISLSANDSNFSSIGSEIFTGSIATISGASTMSVSGSVIYSGTIATSGQDSGMSISGQVQQVVSGSITLNGADSTLSMVSPDLVPHSGLLRSIGSRRRAR